MLALEIEIQDRNVERRISRHFERRSESHGAVGDGAAKTDHHVLKRHQEQHVVLDKKDALALQTRSQKNFPCPVAAGLLPQFRCSNLPSETYLAPTGGAP